MRSEDTGGEKVQRIGVFVCHCGSNIAATVDVKKVVEIIAKEPGVVDVYKRQPQSLWKIIFQRKRFANWNMLLMR